MNEMFENVLKRLNGAAKTVYMGIGEVKLSDDGVGPYIISKLLNYSNEKFLFINAAINPMSRIDDVVKFNASHLVLLDTCTLHKPPGTVAIIELENIKEYVPISSHTIPVHIVVDLILEKLPDLKVFMIGIVPESLVGFTEVTFYEEGEFSLKERNENQDLPFFAFHLSETIQKAANQIIQIIKEIIQRI